MAFLSLLVNAGAVERGAVGLRGAAALVAGGVFARTVGTPAATLLAERIRAEAPVRSGKLRASIRVEGGGASLRIMAVGYAGYVTAGTRPHLIAPRNAKVLRFTAGGQIVYASLVNHPGTKPNDFPRRALDQATPGLRLLLGTEGERLIRLVRA